MIKYIKRKIRILINFLFPWLSKSGYPHLNLHTRKKTGYLKRRMSNSEEFIDKVRRSFWRFFAEKHKPFKCCYLEINNFPILRKNFSQPYFMIYE